MTDLAWINYSLMISSEKLIWGSGIPLSGERSAIFSASSRPLPSSYARFADSAKSCKISGKKTKYYIDSDVFFSDIVDLTDSWDFFLIFWFFSESLGRQNLNIRLGPSGGAEAGAEPLGPSRMFKFCRPSDSEKKSKYSEKSPNYSAKSTILRQK